MKILLMGDASNYHFALSQGLATLGHDVTVASHGSRWMDTCRNIDLRRRPGKLGGLWLWLRLNTMLASDLKGYDIVHISNPVFLDLRPERVRHIFDKLRRHNGSVFLTALGTDTPYIDMCLADRLRYTEWQIGGKPTPYALEHPQRLADWQQPLLSDLCRHIYDRIDGAIAALYEYYLSISRVLPPEKIAYAGIPVETAANRHDFGADGKLRIMLGCHKGREAEKGADKMLPILQELSRENAGKVAFDFVQNVPFAQFQRILDRADVVVDQLYSYSPATTALMAMARGKAVASGGEPEYYDFIGEDKLRPIINIDPLCLDKFKADMQHFINHPSELQALAVQGPEFARRHNSLDVVARRFADFWERRLNR